MIRTIFSILLPGNTEEIKMNATTERGAKSEATRKYGKYSCSNLYSITQEQVDGY